jgi:hypothetical protein
MKKLVGFDLDGTLTASKSPLTDRMSSLLDKLLDEFQVCVMSGGKFTQFESQLLANLRVEPKKLKKLHLMPTCGTRYYVYEENNGWKKVYAEDFSKDEKNRILAVLNEGIDHFSLREKKPWGEIVEDRGSQITFSALGQDIVAVLGDEGVRRKKAWDPSATKRTKLQNYVMDRLPDFEIRLGGETSIDITKPGIDKAYGIHKLIEMLGIKKEEILFIGDRLEEGGNDYPVKAMGVDSIAVSDWEDTALIIEAITLVAG